MNPSLSTCWSTCCDCGADAELPALDAASGPIGCPDCDGVMVELWRWAEPALSR